MSAPLNTIGPAEAFRRRAAVRNRISAVALLAIMAGIVSLTVALYSQAFIDTANVTVRAERAGLQMRKGTIVKLRGVDVGRTGKSTLNPDGSVDVELKLKPEMLDDIPSNVIVSLEQLTAFGNKHIALTVPSDPAPTHVEAGDVIDVRNVSVEINTVYEHLADVLAAAKPAKVNAVLGALAESLEGQGENLGQTLETLNTYIGQINGDLPALQRDFEKGADVLGLYADVAPDLMSILANGSVTAESISSEKDQLARFLDSMDSVSARGTAFLARNADPLIDVLASSLPTTELLERYSPQLSCFLKGLDKANRLIEHAFGTQFPGLVANVTVMASENLPYRLPDNLPVMGARNGPDCLGLPGYDGKSHLNLPNFDLGGTARTPVPEGDAPIDAADTNLLRQLFGTVLIGAGEPQ
ncbi:MAG TPA: MCE family protein [Nocardioidaceae bacterium]|nr:MCE family protein [Nocardioidaceae bacterium]